jgi:hypothetical protein
MKRRRTLVSEEESTMSEEYELVGTASITEETATVEIQLSKPCTDVYLFCENLKSTANSQLYIDIGNNNVMTGVNSELSTNVQNTIQHIQKIGKTWMRTGSNHVQYPLTTAVTQMYTVKLSANEQMPEQISTIKLATGVGNPKIVSGTIEIYGR